MAQPFPPRTLSPCERNYNRMKAFVYRGPGKKQLEDMAMAGKLQPKQLSTHHFALADILKACDTFDNAGGNAP